MLFRSYVYSEHPVNNDRKLYLIDMDKMRTLRFRAEAWDENLRELGYLEATGFAEGEAAEELREAV